MLALGVLVSGNGTNLQAVLDAIQRRELDAEVRMVISNQPDAKALARAESAGVPTCSVRHGEFASREEFDHELVRRLRAAGAEWVLLAGFMRVLTPVFLGAFRDRIVNIHPALLPAFPGVRAQAQALAYGVKVAGCTVHFVDEGVDAGPVIAQRAVDVLADDGVESLSARILEAEHQLVVEALSWIAQGRVELVQGSDGSRRVARVRAS